MFMLTGSHDCGTLKTYSASSRAGKHILKIEVEYDTAIDMAYDVDALQKLADARKLARLSSANNALKSVEAEGGSDV